MAFPGNFPWKGEPCLSSLDFKNSAFLKSKIIHIYKIILILSFLVIKRKNLLPFLSERWRQAKNMSTTIYDSYSMITSRSYSYTSFICKKFVINFLF